MKSTQFDPDKRIYGILYATTTALFWGLLAIFIKVALKGVDPIALVWFRFAVAFTFLFAWFSVRDRKKLVILRRPPWLLIIAALGLTLNYIGFAKGIDYTTPSNAQIFIQLGPMSLALSGIVIFKEKLKPLQIAGFLVAGGGFYLFYHDQLQNLLKGHDIYITGVLWLVTASLAWTVYASLQKKLVGSYHAQQLNLVIYGLPVLVLLPVINFSQFANLSPLLWILIFFLGINTIVAYGALAEAFKYIEANKISVIITLNPIITFVAMTILDIMDVQWIDAESITLYGLAGALLVITGAALVVISGNKKGENS